MKCELYILYKMLERIRKKQLDMIFHKKAYPLIRVPAHLAKLGLWCKQKLGMEDFFKPFMVDYSSNHYEPDMQDYHKINNSYACHDIENDLPIMIDYAINNLNDWTGCNQERGMTRLNDTNNKN